MMPREIRGLPVRLAELSSARWQHKIQGRRSGKNAGKRLRVWDYQVEPGAGKPSVGKPGTGGPGAAIQWKVIDRRQSMDKLAIEWLAMEWMEQEQPQGRLPSGSKISCQGLRT